MCGCFLSLWWWMLSRNQHTNPYHKPSSIIFKWNVICRFKNIKYKMITDDKNFINELERRKLNFLLWSNQFRQCQFCYQLEFVVCVTLVWWIFMFIHIFVMFNFLFFNFRDRLYKQIIEYVGIGKKTRTKKSKFIDYHDQSIDRFVFFSKILIMKQSSSPLNTLWLFFSPNFFRLCESVRERYGLIIQFLLSEFCNTQKKLLFSYFRKIWWKNENSIYQEKKFHLFFLIFSLKRLKWIFTSKKKK